jgi:tetratricopeptide (TPR) repeat protein
LWVSPLQKFYSTPLEICEQNKAEKMKIALSSALSILLLFVSCSLKKGFPDNLPTSLKLSYLEAEKLASSNPTKTIAITDSLLISDQFKQLAGADAIKILEIRQKTFGKLGNMKEVISTGAKIIEIAEKTGDSLSIAKSLLPIKGDIDFSEKQRLLKYLPGAISTFEKYKMAYEQGVVSASLGSILCNKGDYINAQTVLLKAYDILTKLDSTRSLINVCNNIATAYTNTNNPQKALEYYKTAYNISNRINNPIASSYTLMNIGVFYHLQKNIDSSLNYLRKSISVLPSGTPYFAKMKAEYNMANVYLSSDSAESAELIFKKISDTCRFYHQAEGIAMAEMGIGEVYSQKNKFDAAISHLKEANNIFDSLGLPTDVIKVKLNLVSTYKKKLDYKNALIETDELKKINDSLLSKDKQVAIVELEQKYQTKQKEIQINSLKTESKIRLNFLILLSAALIILIAFWYRGEKLNRNIKNANTALIKKYKEEIESRQKKNQTSITQKDKEHNTKSSNKETALFNALVLYYNNEKPFLDPKLKAEAVSKHLQISPRTLTAILKSNGYSSFANFTNKFRVEEVIIFFEDPANAVFKSEVLATKAGFGNKQSFYSAFEEFTGLKPSIYRTELWENKAS